MKERELRNVDCMDLLYDTAISLTSARQLESLYQAIVDKGCLLARIPTTVFCMFSAKKTNYWN